MKWCTTGGPVLHLGGCCGTPLCGNLLDEVADAGMRLLQHRITRAVLPCEPVCCSMTSTELSVHQHPRLKGERLLLRRSINLQPTSPAAPSGRLYVEITRSSIMSTGTRPPACAHHRGTAGLALRSAAMRICRRALIPLFSFDSDGGGINHVFLPVLSQPRSLLVPGKRHRPKIKQSAFRQAQSAPAQRQ